MGTATALRTDYSSKELRSLARRVKNAGQARRLLAIAALLDGALREDAADVQCPRNEIPRNAIVAIENAQ